MNWNPFIVALRSPYFANYPNSGYTELDDRLHKMKTVNPLNSQILDLEPSLKVDAKVHAWEYICHRQSNITISNVDQQLTPQWQAIT